MPRAYNEAAGPKKPRGLSASRSPGTILLALLMGTLPLALPAASAKEPSVTRWRLTPRRAVAERFDQDEDGHLNRLERDAARRWLALNPRPHGRAALARRRWEGPGSKGKSPPTPDSRAKVLPEGTPKYADHAPFDEAVVRTFFLDFENQGWETELQTFFHTDIEVPARLQIDGETLPGVGVRFRGNSSYTEVAPGRKRPLNLSLDFSKKGQAWRGLHTLNLLNAHGDPSLLREWLHARIAQHHLPIPRVAFIRFVINGQDWGIYLSVEQVNRDFLSRHFAQGARHRFKVPPFPLSLGGPGGLRYHGENLADYERAYQIKGPKGPDGQAREAAFRQLIALCKLLQSPSPVTLRQNLPARLNVEGALWLLALEFVLCDGDGYLVRASDYLLVLESRGRFTLLPHDNNETFRFDGGGPVQAAAGEHQASPLDHAEDPQRPLVRALLSVPEWRTLYLDHVRELTTRALDWKSLRPVLVRQRKLISPYLKVETRGIYPFQAFVASLEHDRKQGPSRPPSLKRFVLQRRHFLLGHPELAPPHGTTQSPPETPSGEQ